MLDGTADPLLPGVHCNLAIGLVSAHCCLTKPAAAEYGDDAMTNEAASAERVLPREPARTPLGRGAPRRVLHALKLFR